MNIVLLDDERVSLAVLRNHVSQVDGARGFPFTHPTDALRWCAAHRADAVVIDFMMHEMDGLEFAARFRQLPGNERVPILMVTGLRDEGLRQRAHEAGISDFLTKPLDVQALRRRLRELFALQRRMRAPAAHDNSIGQHLPPSSG